MTEFYAKELSFLTFEWEGEAVNLEVVLAKMSVSTDATYRRNAMKVRWSRDFRILCSTGFVCRSHRERETNWRVGAWEAALNLQSGA